MGNRRSTCGSRKRHDSWDELLRGEGQVVIAKLPCNIKHKPSQGKFAWLLTSDATGTTDSYGLPSTSRLTEVLEDAADWDECLVAGEILSHLSCDFADAFHNFAVNFVERLFLVAKHLCSGYVATKHILFGGGRCPLVRGKGSAYLCHSGQSLFDEREARNCTLTTRLSRSGGPSHAIATSRLFSCCGGCVWDSASPGVNYT